MTGRRAQSTVVGYVLSVAIATVLIAGLITGMGTFVTDEQTEAASGELRVVGERVAAKLMAADALAVRHGGTVYAEPAVPASVVNSGYRVTVVVNGSETLLRLEATSLDASATVRFTTTTPVAESSATGGNIAVRYDGTVLRLGGERP